MAILIGNRPRRGGKGFTLIELMIVITIMAVLMAILIPNLVRAKYNAHLASCEYSLRSIASALEIYHTDEGVYPAALDAAFFQSQMSIDPPTCPSSDTPYTYLPSADLHDFVIFCKDGIHSIVLGGAVDPEYPQYTPSAGLLRKPLP